MPDKDGDDDKKSTKSVVNKKQKQIMNQEDYIPEKLSPENVNRELDKMDVRDKNRKPLISKEKSDSIQSKDAFKKASEYATKQRPKIGGGERPDLKSKGGSASTGASDTKIGGPKENPKSAGGLDKGNTPVKVNIKKKINFGKYFGEEGYDTARDLGKVSPSKNKKDATTMPVSKEMRKTQKVNKGPSALERIRKKYKGQIMDELDLTQVAEAFGGYIIEATTDEENKTKTKKKINQSAYDKFKEKKGLTGNKKVEVTTGNQIQGPLPPPKEKSSKVTTSNEPEKKKFKSFMKSPEFYKKDREKVIQKRKEYGIDPEGKTATDAGIERYATKTKQLASGRNVPVKVTQDDKDLAKKRMLGDPEDPTTGTGKYGGRMSKQMDPKTLQKLRTKLKTQGFIGDNKPEKVSYDTKDRVTVNTSDTDKVATPKPKPSKVSMIATAARKNPAAALAAYDLGKGIIGKITKLRMPSVQGGKAGFRSAGG